MRPAGQGEHARICRWYGTLSAVRVIEVCIGRAQVERRDTEMQCIAIGMLFICVWGLRIENIRFGERCAMIGTGSAANAALR